MAATRTKRLAVGDGEVGGVLGQGVNPTAEAAGDRLEERLADARLNLPSHRPPLEVAELGVSLGVAGRDAELAERLATPLEGGEDLGAETAPREGRRVDGVEPDGPGVADLGVQGHGHRLHRQPVARRLPVSLLELLEQVGRHAPLPGVLGGDQRPGARAPEGGQPPQRAASARSTSPASA